MAFLYQYFAISDRDVLLIFAYLIQFRAPTHNGKVYRDFKKTLYRPPADMISVEINQYNVELTREPKPSGTEKISTDFFPQE